MHAATKREQSCMGESEKAKRCENIRNEKNIEPDSPKSVPPPPLLYKNDEKSSIHYRMNVQVSKIEHSTVQYCILL